ncbi:hypothetical protein HKD37_15G042518 [Glycine soja]
MIINTSGLRKLNALCRIFHHVRLKMEKVVVVVYYGGDVGLNSENNAEAEAATVTAPSRSKRHSDGDAEHEANAFQEKSKVTVVEASFRINADDLDTFLVEIIVSVSFLQLACLGFFGWRWWLFGSNVALIVVQVPWGWFN